MGTLFTILLVVILVVLVIYAISQYNGLVKRRNEVEESYRQIDVQLKRRYDLIPNLLEGVKKYFQQEKDVLTQITEARSQAMQPQSPGEQAQSESRLSGAIGNLFAVSENYPELRSNTVLIDFQEELSSTENKISFARQHYNDSVQVYNTKIQSFPAVIFARAMGFTEREYFEAVGPERESVTVSYD
ncbi:MAG: LemA family protein [Actinomycetota bacterium]|jgi:LemA protein|nr:LemA family protein [Rubrobacter sp.]MDQ3506406.1 LemA family protein [Actinomycetota bacterium]